MNPRKSKTYFVMFAGGETAGPIMPLLAVAQRWKKEDPNMHPLFVDIRHSVASRIVPLHHIPFFAITAGKLRRYLSVKNILSPFLIVIGFFQALLLMRKYHPALLIGAGGYVQIPCMLAAWVMRIPRLIHQQDVTVTLSNVLCAPLANKITTVFEDSTRHFSQGLGFDKDFSKLNKVAWIGNPTSPVTIPNKTEAYKTFGLSTDWPTILVIGGGSGAVGLNNKIIESLSGLGKIAQVLHSTGVGKSQKIHHPRYHQYEFIDNMPMAYAAADIVIARAGIGTLTELAHFRKCSIIVPMPHSHQEANAALLYTAGAALILDQETIDEALLVKAIRKILFDIKLQNKLQEHIGDLMPQGAAARMQTIAQEMIA